MGWLDRIKQGLEQAKDEAEDIAAIGRLKVEILDLNRKMGEKFKEIGAKAYDLSEAGTSFPAEIATLCREADTLADQIKAKEAEIVKVKAG
jgi:uncharacterized coiled-coil DUF342 family protein